MASQVQRTKTYFVLMVLFMALLLLLLSFGLGISGPMYKISMFRTRNLLFRTTDKNQSFYRTSALYTITMRESLGLFNVSNLNETQAIKYTKLKVNKTFQTQPDNHKHTNQKQNMSTNLLFNDTYIIHDDTQNDTGPVVPPTMCKDCFKTDFKTLINAPDICNKKAEVNVLIMISSTPNNNEARNVIRRTWGIVCNDAASLIQCVYVFGKSKQDEVNKALVEESQLRHDVLQFDFHDTYANLTYKTMMSLQWASDNCPQAKYIMKTDDDVFLNTELLPVLLEGAPDSKFFGGFCWGKSHPHRDRNSKWYVSIEQFSESYYPKMCSGTGYVMSSDVVLGILQKAINIPFFYLEDVYVSLCLNKLGIQPVLLTGFNNMRTLLDSCSYRNQIITSHGFSPKDLEKQWTSAQKCKKVIRSPKSVYLPRHYNSYQ